MHFLKKKSPFLRLHPKQILIRGPAKPIYDSGIELLFQGSKYLIDIETYKCTYLILNFLYDFHQVKLCQDVGSKKVRILKIVCRISIGV